MTRNDFYEWFFSEDSKKDFERLEEIDNSILMAMLDDIVQCMAMESNQDWTCKQDVVKKNFRKLKNEIFKRMQ